MNEECVDARCGWMRRGVCTYKGVLTRQFILLRTAIPPRAKTQWPCPKSICRLRGKMAPTSSTRILPVRPSVCRSTAIVVRTPERRSSPSSSSSALSSPTSAPSLWCDAPAPPPAPVMEPMGRCTVCTSALWLASSCTASSATKMKEPAEKVRAVPTCLAEIPPPPLPPS